MDGQGDDGRPLGLALNLRLAQSLEFQKFGHAGKNQIGRFGVIYGGFWKDHGRGQISRGGLFVNNGRKQREKVFHVALAAIFIIGNQVFKLLFVKTAGQRRFRFMQPGEIRRFNVFHDVAHGRHGLRAHGQIQQNGFMALEPLRLQRARAQRHDV